MRLPLDHLRFLLITLTPADLASAYIISPIARPDLALQHLQYVRTAPAVESVLTLAPSIASSLAPEDPEIAFNLAAVLEACTLSILFRITASPFFDRRSFGGRPDVLQAE